VIDVSYDWYGLNVFFSSYSGYGKLGYVDNYHDGSISSYSGLTVASAFMISQIMERRSKHGNELNMMMLWMR